MKENNYIVSIAVDSRIDVPVSAKTPEEAKEKALIEFMFLNLQKANQDVISYHAVNATDENGNLTDF